ncbi:hypothetical protein MANES_13G047600v8 [Manihot esculenta]|nr:hypothetical protein MANES_13G047600v8 [Manihot esculenta]
MAPLSILTRCSSLKKVPKPSLPNSFHRRPLKHLSSLNVPCRLLPLHTTNNLLSRLFRPSLLRIRSAQGEDAENFEVTAESLNGQDTDANEKIRNQKNNLSAEGNSFLLILAIAVGVAAIITITSIGLKRPSVGSFFGVQFLAEGSTSSALASSPVGFTFKAFGYRIILPEYAPGWIYFWLLMAAGCGLFISEEALNVWVGITLSRLLSVDGTWQSFVESFSRNAPYIMSTVFWVYWGVCISDMIPFYLGKFFTESGATDDVCSKLGIGEEKVSSITRTVQRYGNLAGIGYISRVFLRWSLLWWLDNPSSTARDWISTEGTPCGCPCHRRHSSGDLDHISICSGCFDSTVPLYWTPQLYLAFCWSTQCSEV